MSTTVQSFVLPVRSADPTAMFGESEFTYVDISAVDRDRLEIVTPQVLTPDLAPSRARQVLAPGDVIVSTVRPNLNTVALVPESLNGAIASTGFCVLRPNQERLDNRFLFHWIASESTVRRLIQQATGATYPAVSDKVIKSQPFTPPDLAEQQRIAAVLDRADSLRRKRQEAIRLADEFLSAAFFELLGDPAVNPRGWPERSVSEIGIVTTGNTPDRSIDANFGNAIEWIKSDNINTPSHRLTTAREGLSTKGMERARIVSEGSTLMTCIAGSPSCIGNVAMADRRVAFNQQINAITPKDDIDPKFLYLLLLFSKARIQATSTNSMKGMVSKGTLEKVRLIWPPKSLQDRLVQVFDKVAKLQTRMEETEQLNLYKSLQAQLLA